MSSSGAKNKGIAAKGGAGSSSSSETQNKNKSEASKGTTARAKKERPREAPVSKFMDLRMHGFRHTDPDADEFYEALLEARRDLDAWQDKHSK
jgi:hypothetical protein